MKINIGITATDFAGNKGAAAMLQSIIKNIKKEHESVDFMLFSVYPYEDRKQNPYDFLQVVPTKPQNIIFIAFPLAILYRVFRWIKPIKKLLLKNKILNGVSQCDFILDAAGISFVDSRGFVMNTYNFICAATPLLLGKDVIKLSQAMGPCKSLFNKLWAKIVMPKLYKICSRGEYTHEYLQELGLKNVELCADIAFLMPDDKMSKDRVEDIIAADDFYKSKFVTLSISSVVYKYCLKSNIDYYKTMKEFVAYLNSKGYGVLLIANAARAGEDKLKNNDLPIGDTLYAMLDNKDKIRWYSEEFTPEIIREFISKSEILIASRFHAMIGALEKSVPVLLIGWSHKYKEVLNMFNLGEYAVDYKKLNYVDLVDMFEKVEANREHIANTITENLDKVKQSSKKNFDIVFKKMDEVKKQKQQYIGNVLASYAGYSKNEEIRKQCASGGIVTGTLVHLLETEKIDGALVARQYIENGEVKVKSFIAKTAKEIMDSATSIYVDFNLNLTEIENYDGNLAVVCLPCQLKILKALEDKIGSKIKYKLTLFCGGVAKKELVKRVLEKNSIDINNAKQFVYRRGHWRGNSVVVMNDDTEVPISYKYNWCTYKNALYYSAKKCFACDDLFGYDSDFSFGDIWLAEMKENPVKHTAILARNKKAAEVIEEMKNAGKAHIIKFEEEKILKGNRRALVYKYKTAEARKKFGKKHGLNISSDIAEKSKWNHYLASRLIIRNMVRSKNAEKMDETFKRNKYVMFVYMGIIRFLLSW